MYDLEINIKGQKYIAQSQRELAAILDISKTRVNQLIGDLVLNGYIKPCGLRVGKYDLTDLGVQVVEAMEWVANSTVE